jgi:hypothetical protein
MFHRWAALVLVLALCAISPKTAAGQTQSQQSRGHGAGAIGKPSRNPFNPDVKISFSVGDSGCTDLTQQHAVTVRILNILVQQVAIPVLYGSDGVSTVVASGMSGALLANLRLVCGNYVAYWNGKVQNTGREAPSGPYLVQIIVDGKPGGAGRIYHGK